MARLVRVTSEGEEAVASATVETLVQLRGVTTLKGEIAYFRVSADYEATTELEQVLWELLLQSTDGTATGATEAAGDPDDPTPAITGFHSFSAEPTPSTILDGGHFPASGGNEFGYFAENEGFGIDSATSSRIGLRVTTSVACNCYAMLGYRVLAA